MPYSDKSEAAELAGSNVAEGDITDEEVKQVDTYIDLCTYYYGFKSNTITEYHDIEIINQDGIILNYMPIIKVNELIDNAKSDNPVTLTEDKDFVLYKNIGMIKLISEFTIQNEKRLITSFTRGYQTVKVNYDYGYESVPEDIKRFANLLLARWKRVQYNLTKAGVLTSVSIGNYRENKSNWSVYNTDLDDLLMKLEYQLKIKYNVGV